MTYTDVISQDNADNEIFYVRNGQKVTDGDFTWEDESNSLVVTGTINQKVSNITLDKKYHFGDLKAITFQGGNYYISSDNAIYKLNSQRTVIDNAIVSGTVDFILTDGVSIYALSTLQNTLFILDNNLVTKSIITDGIDLFRPTRMVRYGKYLFVTCDTKLTKFNTLTRTIESTYTITSDKFIDVTVRGSSIITLRQASISEIDPDTLQLIKNVPSSSIISPRRIQATSDLVFVLDSSAILTFDYNLSYKGKRTGLLDASCMSVYGSFMIIAEDSGSTSIYDLTSIPVNLITLLPVSTTPNSFQESIIVGNNYYLTDMSSGYLFKYFIDGINVGGMQAGSAQITNIESTNINADSITANSITTNDFYTTGNLIGESGLFGGLSLSGGVISGSSVEINSGTQGVLFDGEGFKYLNNLEEVIVLRNDGSITASGVETENFYISNGVNRVNVKAHASQVSDYALTLPAGTGSAGNLLSTDGLGNLQWRALNESESGGNPGGFTGQIQFNNEGLFDASDAFTWDGSDLVVNQITLSDSTITIGSMTVSGSTIEGLQDPVASDQVATKNYVDVAVQNTAASSAWKDPVIVATTSNITLLGLQTVDSVTLNSGDRVLVKSQTNGVENGIYISSANAWSRSDDLLSSSQTLGVTVTVLDGERNKQTTWICTSGSTADVSELIFEQNLTGSVSWKESVKVATTVNISPFPPTDGVTTVSTVDGITLVIGDRILVKNQTNGIENGIYTANVGTWSRTNDMAAGNLVSGSAMWINQGTAYGDKGFVCVSDNSIAGTDALLFDVMATDTLSGGVEGSIQFNNSSSFQGSGDLTWDGTDLTINGNVSLKEDGTSNTIKINAPSGVTPYELSLPTSIGTSNQVLSIGSTPGTMEWVDKDSPVDRADVTQLTDVNTAVTANAKSGRITTVSLSILSHRTEQFAVVNNACLLDSIVMCNIISYNGSFNLHCGVTNIMNGQFDITLTNSSGGTLDAPAIIGFFII